MTKLQNNQTVTYDCLDCRFTTTKESEFEEHYYFNHSGVDE